MHVGAFFLLFSNHLKDFDGANKTNGDIQEKDNLKRKTTVFVSPDGEKDE